MGKSKAVKRDKKSQLIKGLQTHFGKQKTITLKGKPVTIASLTTGLQASIDAGIDTDAKRVAFLESSKASKAAEDAIHPMVVVLTDFLQSTMSATDLADFGMKPKARVAPDVATKAHAALQSAATRKARGTLGPKARLKIVGVVEEAAPPQAPAANGTPATATAKTGATSN
jgi:hypothetical protein